MRPEAATAGYPSQDPGSNPHDERHAKPCLSLGEAPVGVGTSPIDREPQSGAPAQNGFGTAVPHSSTVQDQNAQNLALNGIALPNGPHTIAVQEAIANSSARKTLILEIFH